MCKVIVMLVLGLGLLASCKKDDLLIKPIDIKKKDVCMGCAERTNGIDTTKYTKGF